MSSIKPSIVQNGLLFCLDAANLKSYSGSGTIWSDISGNGITATLQNSGAGTVAFSNGAAVFSAVDASSAAGYYLINDSSISSLTTQLTIESWVKTNAFYTTSGKTQAVPISPRITETSQPIGYSITSSSEFSLGINGSGTWYTINTSNILDLTNWICVAQTTDDTNKVMKTYYNGQLVNSLSYSGTPQSGGGILIGRGFYGGANNYNGKVSIVRCYNRVLTATEVLQNYNAIKGRYGL